MVQEERVKIISIRCLYQQQQDTLCNSTIVRSENDDVYEDLILLRIRDVLYQTNEFKAYVSE